MKRRDMLKSAGALAAWSGFWATSSAAEAGESTGADASADGGRRAGPSTVPAQTREGDMLYRTLGRNGPRISALGVGGYHIGQLEEKEESIRLIRTAIDRGITFMDNSWDYHAGKSEEWMGAALKDGYRDKVLLMTKLDGRTKALAARHIEESLQRLEVEHIDLMQIHEVIRLEDPDRCFGENGAMDALRAARKAGKIRYIGFTGHKDPYVHNRMLDVAAEHEFRFDAVQMPLNILDASFRSFAQQVLPRLVREGIAVLGMKPLASGAIVKNGIATPAECLTYALTLPTSVVITGMESMKVLEQNLAVVKSFQPIAGEQMTALLARTAAAARTGRYEGFKTGMEFDATTKYPEWIG